VIPPPVIALSAGSYTDFDKELPQADQSLFERFKKSDKDDGRSYLRIA